MYKMLHGKSYDKNEKVISLLLWLSSGRRQYNFLVILALLINQTIELWQMTSDSITIVKKAGSNALQSTLFRY